jgi:hypothetical protein
MLLFVMAIALRNWYNFFRNRGERNAAHDNYIVRKVDRLVDGGHFYDALAIHVFDPRIKDKINASRKLTMTEYQALFATDICDLPTHQYLRNPLLTSYLDPIIVPRAEQEAVAVENRLRLGAPAHCALSDARIAICNVALDSYAGSELWVSDVAKYLKTSGRDVIIYSPHCGKVAADLRSIQIPVTSSIEEVISFDPSVLHLNHFESANPLVQLLKDRAVIFKYGSRPFAAAGVAGVFVRGLLWLRLDSFQSQGLCADRSRLGRHRDAA